MKRSSLIVLTLSLLFSFVRAQQLIVIQSNSVNGALYPCRCPDEPKGGLAKQASLIKQLAGDRDYLLLESGDILGLNSDRKSDSLLLSAVQAMRYSAVAVGDQELSRGCDYFLQMKSKFKIPFISANLIYNGKKLTEPYVIRSLDKAGVKVALIGLIAPGVFKYYPDKIIEGIKISDPDSTLKASLDSLKNRADVFILISHLGYDDEIKLARKYPQLSLIIGGHSQNQYEKPNYQGGVPIIESGASGRRLSYIHLDQQNDKWTIADAGLVGITSNLPDDPAIVKIIGAYPVVVHDANTDSVPLLEKDVVHLFSAKGCPDCRKLEEGLIARIKSQYGQRIKWHYHDVDNPLEYILLTKYEKLLNDRNNKLPALVFGNKILGGVEEIERGLEALVESSMDQPAIQKPKSEASPSAPGNGGSNGQIESVIHADNKDSIYLAFVSSQRCQKCGRTKYMLKALKHDYPKLCIREFDLQTKEGKLTSEALGILYRLPSEKRMIAPSAFIGEDYLIDDQINDISLAELVCKHKEGTSRVPWEEARQFESQAGQSIFDRFQSFGALGVIGAGLLDGINPCSLAVLVFFISYLAFTGRKRWEILAVGLSYTFADFLVYFLIGIGGLSFLLSIKSLPVFSRILYWLAVIAGLVLAIFNFKDYLKALKGDLSGLDLQLDLKTKQRIHSVIREKMGAGGLMGGAFMIGIITSVLEFACTGQVYLPTIAFVSQISQARVQAYGYLLLYNLMFEVPMIVVFIIAFWGVSSKTVAGWAQRSVAGVRLFTAILFLFMSLFLIIFLIK